MGPVRRGIILALALAPTPALAEVCDKERPGWNGTQATMLSEALWWFQTPVVLFLLISTAAAVRFRSQWGGLAAVVGWSVLASVLGFRNPDNVTALAIAEGCIASPALFIAVVAAICVGTILYTAPLSRGPNDERN